MPPFHYLNHLDEELTDYLWIILRDAKEEGRIPLLKKKREESPKIWYLKELFWQSFRNFERLKQVLAEGKLEKIAFMIEMSVPGRKCMGSITYPRAGGATGNFARYILLKKEEYYI